MYPHRTVCDTLEEMRRVLTRTNIFNYKRSVSILEILVEENQSMANRMESALEYKSDIAILHKQRSKLETQVNALKKALGKKVDAKRSSWIMRTAAGIEEEDDDAEL